MVLFRFRFSAIFAIMLLLLSSLCLHSHDFVDCRFSPCKLLDSAVVQVKEDTKVAYMTLPKNFLVTVDYYFDTIPYEASQTGSQQLQNVYEIYDVKREKGLLSIYRSMYGGKTMRLYYDGFEIQIPNGKGFEFEFGWNTLTIEVKEKEITVYGKLYDPAAEPKLYIFDLPWPGTIHAKEAIFYASQEIDAYKARRRYISGEGQIKNIYISGSLCCHSTSFYSIDWEENCADGGNNPLKEDIQTCTTCITYQCLDWIVGSKWMQEREKEYYDETGDEVYFGLGAVQNTNDDAGKCFRMKLNSSEVGGIMKKDMIVQAITSSSFLQPIGSFQLFAAGGGFEREEPNACTSYPREYMTPVLPNGPTNYPMFDGPIDDYGWDENAGAGLNPFTNGGWYKGGWAEAAACDRLPEFPICSQYPIDSQRDLCKYTFNTGIRKTYDNYRKVDSMCEVKCPSTLVEATGLRRADEVQTSTCSNPSAILHEEDSQMTFINSCARPKFADKSNLGGLPFLEGFSRLVPCRRDGYSRINSVPTFAPTAAPTLPENLTPTSFPTTQPSNQPTGVPTWNPAATRYPTSGPSTVESTEQSTSTSEKDSLSEKLRFWNMKIGDLGFFKFFGILFACIFGFVFMIVSCCETSFQKGEKEKRTARRNRRRVAMREFEMQLEEMNSYNSDDNEDDESWYSGSGSRSRDPMYEQYLSTSMSTSQQSMSPEYNSGYSPPVGPLASIGDTPRRLLQRMNSTSSRHEVDAALSLFHTPGGETLQRMEVGGTRSAPSSDGSRATSTLGVGGLFTSPTTWMSSSNGLESPRARASSNPMIPLPHNADTDSD